MSMDMPRVKKSQSAPVFPDWMDGPVWLKRGDVHATEAADVVRIESPEQARAACVEFDRRGIRSALVQVHVEGVVVKFYCVPGRFFEHYPKVDAPGVVEPMIALAEKGAAALSLDIFGGDCVYGPNGDLHLIDMNDWPSYGRCRLRAAEAIAAHLEQRSSEKLRG